MIDNGLVGEKKVTFLCPEPLLDRFRAFCKNTSGQEQQRAFRAALTLFMRAPADVRELATMGKESDLESWFAAAVHGQARQPFEQILQRLEEIRRDVHRKAAVEKEKRA